MKWKFFEKFGIGLYLIQVYLHHKNTQFSLNKCNLLTVHDKTLKKAYKEK